MQNDGVVANSLRLDQRDLGWCRKTEVVMKRLWLVQGGLGLCRQTKV